MADQSNMTKDQRLLLLASRGMPIPDRMDLAPPEGQTPRKSDPAALERARAQVERLKSTTFTTYARDRTFQAGLAFVPRRHGTWSDLSEPGKLALLDSFVNWDGVSGRDKRIEFTKVLDWTKLPPELSRQYLDMPRESVLTRKLRATPAKPGAKGRDLQPER